MARASLTASCSASARTASSSIALGVVGGEPGYALERDDLFLRGSGELFLRLVELALAIEELAIALLEHLAALIELLVTLDEAPLLGSQFAAAGASLVFGFAREAELLVLGLEDQFLLAGPGLGLDAARLGLGGLHALGCPHAARQCAEYGSADGGHEGHRHEDRCVHRLSSHPDRVVRPDASCMQRLDREGARSAGPTSGPKPGSGRLGTVRSPSVGRDRPDPVVRNAVVGGAWNVFA